jgi:signal transduction histidine kinase
MLTDKTIRSLRPPSRAVSLAVSAALVLIWGGLRLVVFETTFPLTYALPLLVCVWTQDRVALWAMAVIFAGFHLLKLFWILPAGTMPPAEVRMSLVGTLTNIFVAAIVVHAIIGLRQRLQAAVGEVRQQAEVLREQGEELASQNEALRSQTEEIATLNTRLERRERLLETLLETTRRSGTKRVALEHIANAARDLLGDPEAAIAVFEKRTEGLWLHSFATNASASTGEEHLVVEDGFVRHLLRERRTTCLGDTSLRPDVALPRFPGHAPVRSALWTPIHFAERTYGVFAVYRTRVHDWTEEECRLGEWLADQCGRVLETLRVQTDLREADERKSEFLATLSHELRNPLTPMRFALELIEDTKKRDEKAISIMQRQFHQLVRLVDDLLDATRLSSNKIQVRRTRTDLVSIVQHAVEGTRPDFEAAQHAVVVSVPPCAVWLDADPERLSQVVTNLLNNAARYTPEGGRISVTVSFHEGEAALSVRDTGVGIVADDLERVFDMFTQVGGPGSGGLGIGLALVRGIVELHGGRVEASSDGTGRGSEFRVFLPLATMASPEPESAEATPASARSQPRRVLVVDDNFDSAEMLGAILEHHGHAVSIAHDAETALQTAGEFAPDVALLDIGLPGLNGYDLARRLRQTEGTRHIRLVAVTGWGQDDDRARARDAGFDAHLTKPADPAQVLAAVSGGEG